jgi:hypothetical protein
VQKVREAAARAQCTNNVRQIGIAVHAHHDIRKMLPPLTSHTGAPRYGNYVGGILFTILPQIEQEPLYKAGLTNPAWTPDALVGGQRVRQVTIPLYQCPSDPTQSSGYASNQVGQWGGSSYAANFQLFGSVRGGGNSDVARFKIHNMPDGSSNTVAFAEVFSVTVSLGNGCLWAYPGIDWSWQWTPVIANTRSHAANAFLTPQFNPTLATANKRRAQTPHPALVVLMGDAHVQTVSSSVTPASWQGALRPDDGVVAGSDFGN